MHGVVGRELQADPVIHFTGGTDVQGLRALFRRSNRRHPQRRDWTEIHARRGHDKILVLAQVILQMKRLARIFDGLELNVVDVARQPPTGRKHFHKIFPLRLRISSKTRAHRPIAISLGRDFERRIQRSKLGEFAIEGEVHERLDR